MPKPSIAPPLLLAAWLGAGMTAFACSSSASSPSPVRGGVRFDDPKGLLGDQRAAIKNLIETATARVSGLLSVSGVSITVIPDARRAIGGYGLGGRTFGPDRVELYIDPAVVDDPGLVEARLPPMVAHELHHTARWRGPGYGSTLLEAMVSEGMADHFAVELMGVPVPPWSDAIPRDQNHRYLALAQPEFDSASYNHSRWFFDESAEIPRWTGYTLGFRLIEDYQAAHAGSSAAQLTNTPAAAFRPSWNPSF